MANKYTGSDAGKAGLEVKKTTGTPDVKGVTEIQLDTNLTLTDNGNGGVTIQSSGGGGGSGVTSVGLTATSSALTITGSPITTFGTINISGAGLPSQVVLGNLGLGTLPTPSDPTATIGASANNGTATTTFMRSDATPALETTGVTAATYGSSTAVGQFTVDATGRITSASTVTITGFSSGANPSATIGASANNGTNTTFMRSDATPALETTGVSAGTYGSSTTVGKFTVDATGRITAATDVTISGGGGGYPLFKHDEAPATTNFDPFRLWVNNDTIHLGVSSSGEGADADVSVFTPATAPPGKTPSLATITGIGSEGTNTGREYVFYGNDWKQNLVQYRGGAATQTYPPSKVNPPLYFVNSMREVVLQSAGVFLGNSNLVIYSATTDASENPYPSTSNGVNCVRVIDAGTHLVLNGSEDGGTNVPGGGEPPEEPSNVRILLIVDAPPAIFNGSLGVNYGLVPSTIV